MSTTPHSGRPQKSGAKISVPARVKPKPAGESKNVKPAPSPSLADVAKAAGVSGPAASYALRNRPGVSAATRERVTQIAQKMGYSPDARIVGWMARMQEAKTRGLLPIAWLNTNLEKNAWQRHQFLSPYLEGARERCEQLGYRLEEIWTNEPGMSMRRISNILQQSGIEGAILTPPARHFRLDSRHLACVTLEANLLVPSFHRVMSDLQYNLLLAVRELKRCGYRRIGTCLTEYLTNHLHQSVRHTIHYLCAITPASERVSPLFLPPPSVNANPKQQVIAWLKRCRPEVIIGYDGRLVQWVEEAGYRVPGDVGIVHLAIDDDVRDWAGIHSNRRIVGRAVAEQVVNLIQNRQFGVPPVSFHTLIRGVWTAGRTLSIPAPRR